MGAQHAPLHVRVFRFFTPGEVSACWPWAGYLSGGYGKIRDGNRKLAAHRVVYEMMRGPIPEGLELDHLCRNRACVNPWHLEPVTTQVNILRGDAPSAAQARQTVCKRGHDLTDPANLKPNTRGARQCRACANLARRERYVRCGR